MADPEVSTNDGKWFAFEKNFIEWFVDEYTNP